MKFSIFVSFGLRLSREWGDVVNKFDHIANKTSQLTCVYRSLQVRWNGLNQISVVVERQCQKFTNVLHLYFKISFLIPVNFELCSIENVNALNFFGCISKHLWPASRDRNKLFRNKYDSKHNVAIIFVSVVVSACALLPDNVYVSIAWCICLCL